MYFYPLRWPSDPCQPPTHWQPQAAVPRSARLRVPVNGWHGLALILPFGPVTRWGLSKSILAVNWLSLTLHISCNSSSPSPWPLSQTRTSLSVCVCVRACVKVCAAQWYHVSGLWHSLGGTFRAGPGAPEGHEAKQPKHHQSFLTQTLSKKRQTFQWKANANFQGFFLFQV